MQVADRYQAAYDPGVPRHLAYPEVTLQSLLERTARERPDAIATVFGGAIGGRCIDARLTYRDIAALAEVVKAFVVLRPGASATAKEMADHCRVVPRRKERGAGLAPRASGHVRCRGR